MNHAKMDVLRFDGDDVIATSGMVTYTLSGLGDGNKCTFGFSSSDNKINYSTAMGLKNSCLGILCAYFQAGAACMSLISVITKQKNAEYDGNDAEDSGEAIFNGIYAWDAGLGKYVKQ